MTPKLTGSRSSVQSLITGGCVLSRPHWCSLFFNLRMICQVRCTVSHNTQSLIMSCNGNTECEHVHEVTEGVNYLKSRQAVCWGGWGGSPGRAIFYVMWLTCMQNMEIITTAEVLHIPAAETGSGALLDIFTQKYHHWFVIMKMDIGSWNLIKNNKKYDWLKFYQ